MSCSPAPNGCSGECCVAFNFTQTHEQLANSKPAADDLDQIAYKDMLVPITPQEAIDRHAEFGIGDDFTIDANSESYFKCNRWDEETRLCTRYDERPSMCRDYPYDRECMACDFTSPPDVVARYIQKNAPKAAKPGSIGAIPSKPINLVVVN